MSFWKVAAAQYEPRKTSLTEQVAHHLEFVRAAARQQCQLLVFPSLSLLGCDYSRRALPAPPDLSLLDPLCYAATTWRMTIMPAFPLNITIALFVELRCSHRGEKRLGSTIRVMVHVWAVVPEPSRWSMNNRKVWIWTRPVHYRAMSGRTRPAGVGPSLTIFFTSVLDCRADGKCPW